MGTIKATVECVDDKHLIRIKAEDEEICIPLSEDKPNEVKSAFNKIISRIKSGVFQIELDEVREDLFSQVASEYISQLNREILEVHGQMERLGLIEQDAN